MGLVSYDSLCAMLYAICYFQNHYGVLSLTLTLTLYFIIGGTCFFSSKCHFQIW